MILRHAFHKNFNGHDTPPALKKLLEFAMKHPNEYFCEDFELQDRGPECLRLWSGVTEEKFLQDLHVFAKANASGSQYAIWTGGAIKKPNEAPIVVLPDDSGEILVAARDLNDFLRILSFDTAPSFGDHEVSYDTGSANSSENSGIFCAWLENTFHLKSIGSLQEIEILVEAAIRQYQSAIDLWQKDYMEL